MISTVISKYSVFSIKMAERNDAMEQLNIKLDISLKKKIEKIEQLSVKLQRNRDHLRQVGFKQNITILGAKAKSEQELMDISSHYLKASCEDYAIKTYTNYTLKDFQSYFKILRMLTNKN